jgi:hypothetical protein
MSKLQTCPLLGEGASHQNSHNCQTENKNVGRTLQMGARLTVGSNLTPISISYASAWDLDGSLSNGISDGISIRDLGPGISLYGAGSLATLSKQQEQ